MRRGYALSLFLNLLLLGIIAVMAWLFLVRGNVTRSDDGRTAIILTAGERNMVLSDMRTFLAATQAITQGAAENDIPAIVKAARSVGMASAGNAPTSLLGKLPLAFKTLGFATHGAFDKLAQATSKSGNTKTAVAALGELMLNCTGCHASYKLVTKAPAR